MILLADSMLGRLARWLRLLGHDARLLDKPPVRVPPGALFFTRRTAWAHRQGVVFISHDHINDQLRQAVDSLSDAVGPGGLFSRCLDCNEPVKLLDREMASGRVPDYIIATAERFFVCPQCQKVFWPGSHGERASKMLERLGIKIGTPVD